MIAREVHLHCESSVSPFSLYLHHWDLVSDRAYKENRARITEEISMLGHSSGVRCE